MMGLGRLFALLGGNRLVLNTYVWGVDVGWVGLNWNKRIKYESFSTDVDCLLIILAIFAAFIGRT